MKSLDDLLARMPEMQARAKARNAQELPNALGTVCITAATRAGDAEEAGCEFAVPLEQ